MKGCEEERIKGRNLNEEGLVSWFCAFLFNSVLFDSIEPSSIQPVKEDQFMVVKRDSWSQRNCDSPTSNKFMFLKALERNKSMFHCTWSKKF